MDRPNSSFLPVGAGLNATRMIRTAGLLMLLVAGLFRVAGVSAQSTNALPDQISEVQSNMDQAIAQVQKIVNQPIVAYARQPGMEVGLYHFWFHPGATKPDFNNVDIRTTQETPYAKFPYVTSELNPGVVFPGHELEFNSNTKYFYLNRSLPKKKLTEAEMLEINRLYRIIGHCEQELAQLRPNPAASGKDETVTEETVEGNAAYNIVNRYPILKSNAFRVAIGVTLGLGILYLFRRRPA